MDSFNNEDDEIEEVAKISVSVGDLNRIQQYALDIKSPVIHYHKNQLTMANKVIFWNSERALSILSIINEIKNGAE